MFALLISLFGGLFTSLGIAGGLKTDKEGDTPGVVTKPVEEDPVITDVFDDTPKDSDGHADDDDSHDHDGDMPGHGGHTPADDGAGTQDDTPDDKGTDTDTDKEDGHGGHEEPADDHGGGMGGHTPVGDGGMGDHEGPADDHDGDMDGHGGHTPADDGEMGGHEGPADDHEGDMDGHGGHTPADDGGMGGHEGPADDHDGGMDDHEGHGGHSGDGHDGHSTDLPTTQEEIDAFVAAIRAGAEVHVHDADSSKLGEHTALLNLVDPAEATHIAINHGSWFNPDNWHNGEVPPEDARALIPDGVMMEYDQVSDTRLFTLRVDGQLDFATDADSKMVLDTFVVSPTGTLVIGTEDTPVEAHVNVDIVFANNGAIDVDWDPSLLSRGIISHGDAQIHGAQKDSHEKVSDDPMAGDTSVTFAEKPEGWQIGDTIVIAGTHYDGYKSDGKEIVFHPPEDEIRVITDIQGGTVFFEEALVHDHDTPRADLHTSVANYTRNVSFSTENPETAEVSERGHAMFMHSDQVDVRYAEFHELGRTDKSESAFDVSDFDTIASDSNVKGRYGLHLHRLGTEDQDNPAIVEGNAVYGSPGWGFVHHDSNAILENNASYDTHGAGFVSESGNETGAWNDNIAIFAQGNDGKVPKLTITRDELKEFDLAKGGEGFWFQSRLVDASDNIAASVNTGFVYFDRGPTGEGAKIQFDADNFEFPDALHFDDTNHTGVAPILTFADNEAFASREGLHVVKAAPNQGHDIHTVLDGFTAWEVRSGAHFEYTSHYVLKDFDLIAKDAEQFSKPVSGIALTKNTSDFTIIDASIDGFKQGVHLMKFFTENLNVDADEVHDFILVNPTITGPGSLYKDYDPTEDIVLDTAPAIKEDPSLQFDSPLVFEVGAHTHEHVLKIEGTKIDSLGSIDFPTGTDNFDLEFFDMVRTIAEDGYYTSGGDKYFMLDLYFSDRLTGDIFRQTELVKFDANAPDKWFTPEKATNNGEVSLAELQAMVDKPAELVKSYSDQNAGAQDAALPAGGLSQTSSEQAFHSTPEPQNAPTPPSETTPPQETTQVAEDVDLVVLHNTHTQPYGLTISDHARDEGVYWQHQKVNAAHDLWPTLTHEDSLDMLGL